MVKKLRDLKIRFRHIVLSTSGNILPPLVLANCENIKSSDAHETLSTCAEIELLVIVY